MSANRPAWWPTADAKLHADAGCAHPDECKVAPAREYATCPACHQRRRVTNRPGGARLFVTHRDGRGGRCDGSLREVSTS